MRVHNCARRRTIFELMEGLKKREFWVYVLFQSTNVAWIIIVVVSLLGRLLHKEIDTRRIWYIFTESGNVFIELWRTPQVSHRMRSMVFGVKRAGRRGWSAATTPTCVQPRWTVNQNSLWLFFEWWEIEPQILRIALRRCCEAYRIWWFIEFYL